MTDVIDFYTHEIIEDLSGYFKEEPKIRKWDDLTTEEKISIIRERNSYLPDYIKYASMQRYCKMFVNPSVYIETYQEWIDRMLEEKVI